MKQPPGGGTPFANGGSSTGVGTNRIERLPSNINALAKPRPRCRIARKTLSALLHVFGSILGIVQLVRLYRILTIYNPDTRGGAGSSIDFLSTSRMDLGSHLMDGFVTTTATASASHSSQNQDRPEGSVRTPLSSTAAKRTTLFPPYMFYTAKNISRAEIDSKEYRTRCRQLNPDYELITYDDDMSQRFIVKYYPEWLQLYDSLDVPVMRADMWRYLILHKYGGVYLDGDVDCKKPIDQWGEIFGVKMRRSAGGNNNNGNWTSIGAMVGIEYRRPLRHPQYATKYPPKLQFAQWTMAGQPGHYIYYRTIELINETVAHIRSGGEPPGDAVYITGPIVFSRAVVDFMLLRGRLKAKQISKNPPNLHEILVDDQTLTIETDILVDDLALLHEDAFAYRGRNQGEATHEDHGRVYARHWYKGSWKPKEWKRMTEKQVHDASRNNVVDAAITSGTVAAGRKAQAGMLQARVKAGGR